MFRLKHWLDTKKLSNSESLKICRNNLTDNITEIKAISIFNFHKNYFGYKKASRWNIHLKPFQVIYNSVIQSGQIIEVW